MDFIYVNKYPLKIKKKKQDKLPLCHYALQLLKNIGRSNICKDNKSNLSEGECYLNKYRDGPWKIIEIKSHCG